jgi:hypothetical protein
MPATAEQLSRKLELATNLVRIETKNPGIVRLRTNPFLVDRAVALLAREGFRMRLFASSEQFIIDQFLSDVRACDALMGSCALVGPQDARHKYPMWTGYGEYKMSVGLLPTFQPTDRILFVVNTAPFFDFPVDTHRDFRHLLEPFGARGDAVDRKPIPAPDDERHELIRKMILRRVGADFLGCDIHKAPLELILSTADSAIFIIVEQYYIFRDRGLTEEAAVKELNKSQANTLALMGQDLPLIRHPATLFEYVRHFINSQFRFGQREPMSDKVIRAEMEVVKAFYGR